MYNTKKGIQPIFLKLLIDKTAEARDSNHDYSQAPPDQPSSQSSNQPSSKPGGDG